MAVINHADQEQREEEQAVQIVLDGFDDETKQIDKIDEELAEKLSGVTYDDKVATALALEISNMVKLKCKTLKMPRYKIIVQTFIGENLNQGLRVASKSLWNPKFDNYASGSYINSNLFAVVLVYGSYYE